LTIIEALTKAGAFLQAGNIEAPAKEAGVLLAFLLERDVSYLYAHPETPLLPEILNKYTEIVQKRGEAMPFQYISSNQEFMSLDFHVNPHCLIPRPETEILVEKALSWIEEKENRHSIRILDIGTGSGAIAVSMAYYSKNTVIDALDLSDEALKTAELNAKRYKVTDRINFIEADFLKWKAGNPYSLVLSNPPYIPHREIKNLMPGVRAYEPVMALDGGDDGLIFYHAIADKIPGLLDEKGSVMVEVGLGQSENVEYIFREKGLTVSVLTDLAGIPRVVFGGN